MAPLASWCCAFCRTTLPAWRKLTTPRLRQTDVKAGHFERKVQALEQDRDQWEAKFEEMAKKYAAVQKELEDFQQEIGNI